MLSLKSNFPQSSTKANHFLLFFQLEKTDFLKFGIPKVDFASVLLQLRQPKQLHLLIVHLDL